MNSDDLSIMRHSAAHLLAAAVLELYPGTKLGVGPVIEDGFYYDFLLPRPISEEDLPRLEEEMRVLIKKRLAFRREEMTIGEAIDFFKKASQEFKVQLLEDLKEKGTTAARLDEVMEIDAAKPEIASIYYTGKFVDLCRGPHVKDSGKVSSAFKLTKIAGAYWRGNDKNPQLTRIYGLLFKNQKELDQHFKMLEEAKKRDHRKIGKELDLFTFSDRVGPGLPLWTPKGAEIIETLERLAKREERRRGYQRVRTPHVTKAELYLTSGHLPYYKESMFPPMIVDDGGEIYLKPMNCPHHHEIYASRKRSYRELPLRLAEYGTCYRFEQSGELFGLMRARSLQMNDAHIYCTDEQVQDEFLKVVELYRYYFELFGIEKFQLRLSLHDPAQLGKKYVDNAELWRKTEDQARAALQASGLPFVEAPDEAAFYGPKMDVQIWSSIGREFTLATNQLDFAVPPRFGLTYTAADGSEKTPLVIHRAPLSTHERLIGFLIEHYAGAFPLWLAPVQVAVLSVGEAQAPFARELQEELLAAGVRVEFDDSSETVGAKIRRAASQKIPWTIVVGDKEVNGEPFKIRVFGQEEGLIFDRPALLAELKKHIV